MRKTHGRCRRCDLIFRWDGSPQLQHALCPRCGWGLSRTAARLVKNITIIANEAPPRLGMPEWHRLRAKRMAS